MLLFIVARIVQVHVLASITLCDILFHSAGRFWRHGFVSSMTQPEFGLLWLYTK
jgi:hypothetical protein